ncbi:hypothetical protein BH11VER1_BH11VER1_21920 [soil metagenome]
MNTALRPATLEALANFRQRRKKLLHTKAWITAALVLLSLFLVVALLDRATFMPDHIRQGLSYLGYIGAAITAWWLGMRLVKEAGDIHHAARLMEKADPTLRERMLAAVDLSEGNLDKLPDSAEFRAKLQDDVGTQLSVFKADEVLPTRLLKPWITALSAVAALIVLLSLIPGLHLPGFMARAALPFANLSRPSSVKISIVTPVNPDAMVPIASSVPLGVQIQGDVPAHVMVEIQSAETKPARMELSHSSGKNFEGSIGVGQSSVRYRVRAGDAITAWHTLDARARPRIVEFTKVITPPAYTGLPDKTLTEDHGDVSALDGSTVQLTMKANQAIDESAASMLPEGKSLTIIQSKPDRLELAFKVNGKDDSWQLALTAAQTKFTNDESAPSRIETIADMPPTVAITQPEVQLEVRSDDAVQISGTANDDVGIAKIEIAHAINGADWKELKLMEKSGLEAAISTVFNLAPLTIKTGDSVLVKLVATDLKGQRAESTPVRFFIVENKLNLAQRDWAAKERRLAEQAKAIAEETRELRKEAEQVKANEKKEKNNESEKSEIAMAKLKQNLASVQERSEELWDQLKQAAQEAPNTLKSMEINLVGQHLAELRGKHLATVQEQTKAEQPDEKQLKQAANEAANEAETVANALKAFAAADTAQSAREALEQLAPQQNRLADKAIEANRNNEERAKWQEQQRAALAASENAKKDLEALQETIQDQRKNDVKNQIENLNKKMPGLENALDTPQQHQAPEFVYGQAHEMRNATNQARDTSRWLADETAQKANEMRERLTQQQNSALTTLDQAREKANQAAHTKKEKSNEESPQEQAADKLAEAARQFKDQSELREQNAATNNQAALDMNRLGRALDNVAEQMKRAETPEQIKQTLEKANQLADAARALQADATAQDAAKALEEAKDAAMTPGKIDEQVAAAQASASQLKNLPNMMRQVQSDDQAKNAAQEAANNAQWQRDESQNQQRQMAQERQNGQEPKPIAANQNKAVEANAKAEAKLAEAIEKFAPKVADARQKLEQMTPKLSELAKNAAEALKSSEAQTQQLAEKAENNQAAEQTAEQANALMPQAKADAQKLADLQSALRQEADKADLAKDTERQMARTADVALEQMRQQSPQINSDLQQAAKAPQAQQQAQSLQKAAQAQQQTSKALDQLAQNLQKMEQGQALPSDALAAQKAMEESLGIKQPLDESYQDAKDLAAMMEQAQADPQKALANLEKELKTNPAMQRALSNLAEQTAQESQKSLAAAQNQPQMTQAATSEEAHDLERVARHEQRLGQEKAAEQVKQASQKLQQMAQAAKTDPSKNTPQAAEQAAQSAGAAQQAASQAAKAQQEKTPAPESFIEAAKGAMLAQALDQLDQSINQSQEGQEQAQSSQQGQQGQQDGQQKGKQSMQKSAQQSLAQASEAQAQSMAQDRAQGKVPGQQPSQAAQNKSQQPSQPSQQSSPDAEGDIKQTAANVIVPALTVAKSGDWGHLPSRMAKDLTEASRQEPSPEYRAAIESYYKAIAEKAKK